MLDLGKNTVHFFTTRAQYFPQLIKKRVTEVCIKRKSIKKKTRSMRRRRKEKEKKGWRRNSIHIRLFSMKKRLNDVLVI